MDIFWLVCLFILGAALGRLVNVATHAINVPPRPADMPPRPGLLPPRRSWHRAPILGWVLRAKDAPRSASGSWIRPLLVELLTGGGLAFLYWWEVQQQMLLPSVNLRLLLFQGAPVPRGVLANGNVLLVLHANFTAHAVLMLLMLVASLIDIDEMIIPDEVTVPGTLAALLLAAAYPWSLLPGLTLGGAGGGVAFLTLTSPNSWPPALDGAPRLGSLLIALGCYGAWCVALLPWLWRPGLGYTKAVRMLLAYIPRRVSPWIWLGLPLVGAVVIVGVWWRGGAHWMGLLTALVGMAVGGGLVWVVRFLGGAILRREAMGFGDVTLLAMIGALLGWQAALIVFFLAPLAALCIGVLQWILYRDNVIPYGPYLCLAAGALIIGWEYWWKWISQIMLIGPLVPLALLLCIPLLAVMLVAVRIVKAFFTRISAS